MAKKLLLCATGMHLTAAVWSGRRLTNIREFSAEDEHGQPAFQNFLRVVPGVPVYLIGDTVDEDYRFETLPHAFGGDRREMLDRKLKQLYRSTPYYGAQLQDREGDKRRDDRYLFAALTNAEVFAPWLELLQAAKNPLVGVFPLPMLSLTLPKRLGLAEPRLLLVSKHTAGVRQTYLRDQRFRISRLTPLRAGVGNRAAANEAYAEEIRNTRVYLDALNVTHVDDVVTVAILDQDGSLGSLSTALAGGRRNLRAEYVGPEQLTAKLGIDRAALEASDDALHLYLLGLSAPRLNLAPPALTAGYGQYRTRRALYAVSALGVAAGIAIAGWNLYQVFDLKGQRNAVRAQTAQVQRNYEEARRSFPASPAPPGRLKLTVDVAQRVSALARTPDAAFRAIGQALDGNPEIELIGLSWKVMRPPENQGAPAGTLVQSAVLQLELQTLPGDYNAALQRIGRFVKDLAKQETVASAHTAKLPANLASAEKLTGSTASARKEVPSAAQFEVEVSLKPGV
jgi:hypothetical protein